MAGIVTLRRSWGRQKPPLGTPLRPSTLSSGLRLLWTASEGGGFRAGDSGPWTDAGTLSAGTIWKAGDRGRLISFDGSTGYVVNSKLLNLPLVTIAGRVRVPVLSSSLPSQIVSFADGVGSGTFDKSVRLGGINGLEFYVYDGSGKTTSTSTAGTIATGVWYSFAATADGTTARCYQDGVQVGSVAAGATFAGYSVPNFLWSGNTTGAFALAFDGDWVGVWDRALSDSEIITLHRNPEFLFSPPVPHRIAISLVSSVAKYQQRRRLTGVF